MLKGVKAYLKYASMPSITHISKFLSVLQRFLWIRRGGGGGGGGGGGEGGTEIREALLLINTVLAKREIQNDLHAFR